MVRELEWQARTHVHTRAAERVASYARMSSILAGWFLRFYPFPLRGRCWEKESRTFASRAPRLLRPFRTGAYVTDNMTYTAFPAHHRVIALGTPFFASCYRTYVPETFQSANFAEASRS